MAALRGARLWRLDLDSDGNVAGKEALLDGEYGRLRNTVQAPDGSLWVFTNNRDGRLYTSDAADDRPCSCHRCGRRIYDATTSTPTAT